jgi:hypothetical protein
LCTSSGVIVQDEVGQTWIIVACHRFALDNETVHHPNAHHSSIGTVERISGKDDWRCGYFLGQVTQRRRGIGILKLEASTRII